MPDREEKPDLEAMELRTRLVAAEHKNTNHGHRITVLEAWRQQVDIADARKDEQFKYMDTRFSTLNSKIDGVHVTLGQKIDAVNGTLSWLGKLIIGAVLMAIVAFLVNGGFKIPS